MLGELVCCAAGAKKNGIFISNNRGNASFQTVLTRQNRVFRPPPAAQFLISRNPDLISPNPRFPLFPETTPYFPWTWGVPPQGGGVHVFGKAIGFNLVPGNKAYA